MNKYCIARNRSFMTVQFIQYHTPRGWSRDSSDAYHYDYRSAVNIARKMRSQTHVEPHASIPFVVQAKVLNSHIRRVG